MDAGLKKSRKPNPRENAFPLSSATFCYTIPTFVQGFKRDLVEEDLTETLNEHKSSNLGNQMETAWKAEEARAAKAKTKPSLKRVLFKVFGWEFMFYGLVLALSEAVRLNQPLFLGNLVSYFAPKRIPSIVNNYNSSYDVSNNTNRSGVLMETQGAQNTQ